MLSRFLFVVAALLAFPPALLAQAPQPAEKKPEFTRTEDVVYGRRDGHALTLEVFAPAEKANGAAVIFCVSAGFQSSKNLLDRTAEVVMPKFTARGYTVFAVMHSSTPKYSVPEAVEDLHRAVRFVKASADKYKIDPARVGIAGASSGGHLSLMMGCGFRTGDPKAADPVERQSSRVAAVACFFPPTDFPSFEKNPPKDFDYEGLFPFREFKNGRYVTIDAERRREIGRACSPLYCATKDAAPTLIIHGDEDELVPLKQSEDLKKKFDECGALCVLDVKKKGTHSPFLALQNLPQLADWFDKHLAEK